MALSVSAYKNNTVSSVSGTTFNSNGTPFASGDVGRCIVMTSGSAIGQMRKIVSYTDTNTVVLDYAWNISPFRDYINAAKDAVFAEVNPAASDAWTMSSFFDDIDDTTNINKIAGDQAYELVGTNVLTISSGAFLYDRNISFYGNSSNFDINAAGYVRFGDIDEDGNVFNGIQFIETSGDWDPARSWTNSADGDAGDLHFYNSLISIVDGASGDGIFWSLFESADAKYRIVGCTFNGILGSRIRGDETVLKDLIFEGQGTAPNWQTVGPYGTLGLIDNVTFINKERVFYWNHAYGGFIVKNISFTNINQALVYSTGTQSVDAIIIGFSADDMDDLTYVVNVATTATGSNVTLKNPIKSSVVDADLDAITDSYKRVIWNPSNSTMEDETVTDGSWDAYEAEWWTISMATSGNRTLANGTTTTPYTQAIISYKYLPNVLVEPARLPSLVQFTGIEDSSITEATKATVDAYTAISNGERLYDRSKAWTFDNFDDRFPTKGGLLINGVGTQLQLNAVSLVIDGDAASAFAVSQTGDGTITIDAGSKFNKTAAGFGMITTTGTITIEDLTDVDDWKFDGNVILNAALDLTDVNITGNLTIATGANSTLDFSNVNVDGSVTNNSGSNTLTINSTDGSSLTAGDAGSGNGQTNIVQSVPIKITVKDISSGSVISGAMVGLIADAGGDLPSKESVTIVRATNTATVTHTAHGLVDNEYVIIKGAVQKDYNGTYQITYIDANSYSYTVANTPTTPATGTITSTASIIKEVTDAAGEVNKTFRFTSDQPVTGKVRKATIV